MGMITQNVQPAREHCLGWWMVDTQRQCQVQQMTTKSGRISAIVCSDPLRCIVRAECGPYYTTMSVVPRWLQLWSQVSFTRKVWREMKCKCYSEDHNAMETRPEPLAKVWSASLSSAGCWGPGAVAGVSHGVTSSIGNGLYWTSSR